MGVVSHSLLQGIFLTQRLNPGLLHCRQILYYLSHWGNMTLFFCICDTLPLDSCLPFSVASLIAQSVKNLPAMQETRVQFPGWENPLEKEMAAHSSIRV